MKVLTYFFSLTCLLVVLISACSRNIAVTPTPRALYTHTMTSTLTATITQSATPTQTPTSTLTLTSTATLVSTATQTDSPTDTFTLTSTDTPTDTPTLTSTDTPPPVPDTPTDTPTDVPTLTSTDTPPVPTDTPTVTPTDTTAGCGFTYNPGVIGTVTPVAPSCYMEMEPSTSGGPTGTNDNCGVPEDVGTVNSGSTMEIRGSLSASGNTGTDYDWANIDSDYYVFTTGPAGNYTITLDDYTDGSISNDFDLYIFTAGCALQGPNSYASDPVEVLTPGMLGPLAGATQYVLLVVGWNGAPQSPYRLTISPP